MPVDPSNDLQCRWYAIQCKGGESFRAEENLLNQGFDVFHPTRLSRKKRRGKWVSVTEPLFPYYLFVQLDRWHSNWRPIRSTRGVSRLVVFGDQPAIISNDIIELLKSYEGKEAGSPLFNAGDSVHIAHGPLAGQEATFQEQLVRARNGEERAIVLLQWLNRTQKVEISLNHLVR